MNRRDMIIVAVLMNTGLLAVLFMMAIKSDEESVAPQPMASYMTAAPVQQPALGILEDKEIVQAPLSVSPIHDELDPMINAYVSNASPIPILVDEDLLRNHAPSTSALPNLDTPAGAFPLEVKSEHRKEEMKPVLAKKAAVKSEDKYVEVTVKKGDSLDKIARANGSSVKAIKNANSLDNDRLKIGQLLKVPAAAVAKVEKKAKTVVAKETVKKVQKAAPSVGSAVEFYTIKSGDNPWKIAKKFKVRFEELLKLNNLDEEKARKLKAGDKIRVR